MPVNVDLVRARAADIRAEADHLRVYAATPVDAFTGNPERVRAARYGLVVIVEAASAICNHLCARLGRVPESYPGCFATLGELGIVESALATRLAALARLRNLLVHGYAKVDDQRLHGLLRMSLGDVDAFLSVIGDYVRRESEGPG